MSKPIKIIWPYISNLAGMRVVQYVYAEEKQAVFGTIINNAYGNGYFFEKPDIVPVDIWEKMKVLAKEEERKAI